MSNHCNLCERFAKILGAKIMSSSNKLCVVTFTRNINLEILGRKSTSPLSLAAMFSFEAMDKEGNTLNLGETVILQNEINKFAHVLRHYDIQITALHNHWMFDNPKLMFIHFESIDKPLDFAQKVAEAFKTLEKTDKD